MAMLVNMVTRLVEATGVHLPPWGFAAGLVTVAVVLLPFRIRGERANRARRLLTRAAAADTVVERDRLEAEALAEVRGETHGLLTIASWCVERGRYPLARQVLDTPSLRAHPERRKLLAAMVRADPVTTEALLARVLGVDPSAVREPGDKAEKADEQP